MLNPNIAMLENVISAAVSTQYKEVPPTEEEFLAFAQTMRANMSAFPVTDEDFTEILVRLRASIVIQMDVGVYINIGIRELPQRWIKFLTRSLICSEIRKVKNLFSDADWCWVMSNPGKPQITQQSATKLLILGTELLLFLQE